MTIWCGRLSRLAFLLTGWGGSGPSISSEKTRSALFLQARGKHVSIKLRSIWRKTPKVSLTPNNSDERYLIPRLVWDVPALHWGKVLSALDVSSSISLSARWSDVAEPPHCPMFRRRRLASRDVFIIIGASSICRRPPSTPYTDRWIVEITSIDGLPKDTRRKRPFLAGTKKLMQLLPRLNSFFRFAKFSNPKYCFPISIFMSKWAAICSYSSFRGWAGASCPYRKWQRVFERFVVISTFFTFALNPNEECDVREATLTYCKERERH